MAEAEGVSEAVAIRTDIRVFSRPAGEPRRETSGVGLTLLACAFAIGTNLAAVLEEELVRVEGMDPAVLRGRHEAKARDGVGMAPGMNRRGESFLRASGGRGKLLRARLGGPKRPASP